MKEQSQGSIFGPYEGRPTESVEQYRELWFWSAGKNPESFRRFVFVDYVETRYGWPLALVRFEEVVKYRNRVYNLGLIGTAEYPNTVRGVYRWPARASFSVIVDERFIESGTIGQRDFETIDSGFIEPVAIGGAPHLSGFIPGGLGDDLVQVRVVAGHQVVTSCRTEIPPGLWWK